jgi:hypothetical protein
MTGKVLAQPVPIKPEAGDCGLLGVNLPEIFLRQGSFKFLITSFSQIFSPKRTLKKRYFAKKCHF